MNEQRPNILTFLQEYPWFREPYQFMVEQLRSSRVHHAYLFTHVGNVGQKKFAYYLQELLMCRDHDYKLKQGLPCGKCKSCIGLQLDSNPDLFHLDREDKNISIDAVRSMVDKVQYRPLSSEVNLIYIADTGNLSRNSANAMLKTLEEPPEQTMFILFAPAGVQVLPTIRSRCMSVKLPSPTQEEVLSFAEAHGIQFPALNLYLQLAQGQPEKILLMHQKYFFSVYKDMIPGIYQLLNTLEIEALTNTMVTTDLEVFSWQLEAILNLILIAYYCKPEHTSLTKLEAQFPVLRLRPYVPQVIDKLINPNRSNYDPDDFQELAIRMIFLQNQINAFAPQLGSASSLQSIAYEVASLLALYQANEYIFDEAIKAKELLNQDY